LPLAATFSPDLTPTATVSTPCAAVQTLNGSVLALLLTLSFLLVGITMRPVTPRHFWTFVIIYTEAMIITKYLFQVPLSCARLPHA